MIQKLFAIALLVLLNACTSITPVNEQYSGYLSDYSNLKPVKLDDGSTAMRWYSSAAKDKSYTKVMIKPVSFFPAPRPNEQVSLETLNKISAYMTQQLKSEVGKTFEIVDKPGKDTLYLQFAITGVSTPLKGLTVKDFIPVSLLFTGAKVAAGEQDHVVVLYIEGQATDAMTGELLANGVRQGIGENLKNDEAQLQVENIKNMIGQWAKEIAMLTSNLKPDS